MVETRYRELLAADPDNRALLQQHAERLRQSDAMWAGKASREG